MHPPDMIANVAATPLRTVEGFYACCFIPLPILADRLNHCLIAVIVSALVEDIRRCMGVAAYTDIVVAGKGPGYKAVAVAY